MCTFPLRSESDTSDVQKNPFQYAVFYSMSGKEKLKWSQVDRVKLSDEYIAAGKAGMVIPKKLQKRLKLESNADDDIVTNEPQLRSAREWVIHQIIEKVPAAKRELFNDVLRKW